MFDLNSAFGCFISVCGIYFLYLWLKIVIGGKVPENFVLLSKEFPMGKCKEPEKFRDYLKPRLLVFSLIIAVFGAFAVANGYLKLIEMWLPGSAVLQTLTELVLVCLLPLAALIWFAVCMSRAQKEMW